MERLVRNTLMKLPFFLGMAIMLGAFSSLTFAVVTPELEVLKYFGTQEGNPTGKVVQDANGNLYGTVLIGGDYGHGAVYKIDKLGNYSVLYSFDGANGESPQAGVILGIDGNLYGITSISWVTTTIFKLNISGSIPVYTSLYHTTDNVYIGKIIQASDGNIYGINYLNIFSGVVFKLNLSGATPSYNLLYSPANLDQPIDIIQDSDGKFYGTSLLYGISSENGLSRIIGGTVFQLDISGAAPAYTLLQRFNFGPDFSISSLTKGNDGKLYGGTNPMTSGPATLFEVDTSGVTPVYKQLHAFDRLQSPIGNVIPGIDGKFYGIMDSNGVDNIALFQLDLSGLTPVYTVLLNSNPPNNLIQGKDGNLYGTASLGGQFGGGVIYRIKLNPTPVNTSPVATNDSFVLAFPKHNKPVTVAAPGVLGNDNDGEGDKLSVVGASANKPRIIVLPKGAGRVALYMDGHFTYTPPKHCFYGTQSFSYQVTDGQATSNPATVTLTFRGHH